MLNNYIVFDNAGKYRYILSTVEIIERNAEDAVNILLSEEEYESYIMKINGESMPNLNIDTNQITFSSTIKNKEK